MSYIKEENPYAEPDLPKGIQEIMAFAESHTQGLSDEQKAEFWQSLEIEACKKWESIGPPDNDPDENPYPIDRWW